MSGWSFRQQTGATVDKSILQLPQPPDDTVSCMEFDESDVPRLAAGSWDGSVRVWQFTRDYTNPTPFALANAASPVLKLTFGGGCLFYSTAGGTIHKWTPGHATSEQLLPSPHSSPAAGCVTGVKYIGQIPPAFLDKAEEHAGLVYCTANSFGESVFAILDISTKESLSRLAVPGQKFVDLCLSGHYVFAATTSGVLRFDLASNDKSLIPLQQMSISGPVMCISSLGKTCGGFIIGSLYGEAEMRGDQGEPLHFDYGVAKFGQNNRGYAWAVNCVAAAELTGFVIAGASKAPNDSAARLVCWELKNGGREQERFDVPLVRVARNSAALPVTACTVSPYQDVVAIALGYDWTVGAEVFRRSGTKYKPQIVVFDAGKHKQPK